MQAASLVQVIDEPAHTTATNVTTEETASARVVIADDELMSVIAPDRFVGIRPAGKVSVGPGQVWLDESLAGQLGIGIADGTGVVDLGHERLAVQGIVDFGASLPALTNSAVIGPSASEPARLLRTLLVLARPNQARAVTGQVPFVSSPTNPAAVEAVLPPPPAGLRRGVDADLRRGGLMLAAALWAVSGLTSVASQLGDVERRRSELAVRRALGARRSEIALQVFFESLMVGAFGGVIGVAWSFPITLAVTSALGWVPTVVFTAAVLGVAASISLGSISGLVAALAAGRNDPADELLR